MQIHFTSGPSEISRDCPPLAGMIDARDAEVFQEALQIIEEHEGNEIDDRLGYHLYDWVGLTPREIQVLAKAKNMSFDVDSFEKIVESAQLKKRREISADEKGNFFTCDGKTLTSLRDLIKFVDPTKDIYNYAYSRLKADENTYGFLNVYAKVVGFVTWEDSEDKQMKLHTRRESKITPAVGTCAVVLDQTPFFAEEGGQIADKGSITGPRGLDFKVTDTQHLPSGHILHIGQLKSGKIMTVGMTVCSKIDSSRRMNIMQNHTAVHILNAVLNKKFPETCLKSAHVTDKLIQHRFKNDLTASDISQIELTTNELISNGGKVSADEGDSRKGLGGMSRKSESGETVRRVKLGEPGLLEQELVIETCTGTHVNDMKDVQAFTVLGFSTNKERVHTLQCVTGPRAAVARETGIKLVQNLIQTNEMVKCHENAITPQEMTGKPLTKFKLLKKLESLKAMVDNRRKRAYKLNGSHPLPYIVSQQALKVWTLTQFYHNRQKRR